MSYRISVAATREDWIAVVTQTKWQELIAFYKFGLSTEPHPVRLEFGEIPGLGSATTGNLVLEPAYLAIPKDQELRVIRVERKDGSTVYDVDQRLNLDSFVLRPGGVFGEDHFIIGELVTLHKDGLAVNFGSRLLGRIRRQFHPGNTFKIGPECFRLYNESRIFTVDYRNSQERRPGLNTCFTVPEKS